MWTTADASLAAAATEPRSFDVARPRPATDLAGMLRSIRLQSGRSYLDLTREFARLAFGRGRLGFADYVGLRLFDDAQYRGIDKTAFIGPEASRRIWIESNFRLDLHGIAD